jgi:hypothetical protein
MANLPEEVTASAHTHPVRKISGGDTTIVRRLLALV